MTLENKINTYLKIKDENKFSIMVYLYKVRLINNKRKHFVKNKKFQEKNKTLYGQYSYFLQQVALTEQQDGD